MPPRQRGQAESREVQDGVDGVACRVTNYEKRTLVKVGTEAATRYTFDLKSASWKDDEAIRKQARAHKKWAALAPARASSSSEAATTAVSRVSDDAEAQLEAASGHRTDVLVCRPKRKRQEPDFLQPCEALREFATGSRKRKKPAEPSPEDGPCCTKPACVAVRVEREELRSQLAAEAAAHMQLREQLRELASESGEGSDAAALAGSALQLALLEIIDGEEEEEDPEHDDAEAARTPGERCTAREAGQARRACLCLAPSVPLAHLHAPRSPGRWCQRTSRRTSRRGCPCT